MSGTSIIAQIFVPLNSYLVHFRPVKRKNVKYGTVKPV